MPSARLAVLASASIFVAIFLGGCGGCSGSQNTASDASPSDATAAQAPGDASSASAVSMRDAAPMPCRLLSVTGDVRGDESSIPFAAAAALTSTPWLHLSNDAKLTVKGPTTGRETGFQGPGMIRPCASGEEEAWVQEGKFASSPGTGERPGGEQWVVTPLAVIRYTTQLVTLTVTAKSLQITSKGAAKVIAADGTTWFAVEGSKSLTTTPNMLDAIASCTARADETRDLAAKIAAPGAALGDLAPRHIEARQLARAFCAIARLRATIVQKDDWLQTIDTADARWRTL
jgi:hypothetical protein